MTTRITTLLAVSIALFLAGCATFQGPKPAAATASSLDDLNSLLAKATEDIDATVGSLADLLEHPKSDLRKQYATFTKDFASLEKTTQRMANVASKLQEKGAEFFPAWKAEIESIENSRLRRKIEKRSTKVMEQFDELVDEFDELQEDYAPLMTQLNDIKTALDNDLTPAGLEIVSSMLKGVTKQSERVKDAFQDISEEFEELSRDLSPLLEQENQ